MTPYAQPRRAPRLELFLEVEVVAQASRERVRAFTGNVSHDGCFVRAEKPFSIFTRVWVRLMKGNQRFEADGAVAHSMPGEGMGISFEDVPADQQAILDAWLAEKGG